MNERIGKLLRGLAVSINDAHRKADKSPQIRQGIVTAVNTGPPKSLDVKFPSTDGTGFTTIPKIRYIDYGAAVTYAIGNTVWVHSLGRGRWIVWGRLA